LIYENRDFGLFLELAEAEMIACIKRIGDWISNHSCGCGLFISIVIVVLAIGSLILERNMKVDISLLKLAAVIVGGIALLGGTCLVFRNLKHNNHGFGPNSLKALGLVFFIPTLLIISVTVPDFRPEVLATLLGTVAGYVLSTSNDDKRPDSPPKT
jgi:hypothetical protein